MTTDASELELSIECRLDLLRQMHEIRFFEQSLQRLFEAGAGAR